MLKAQLNEFTFKSNVWLYQGNSGWYFADVPVEMSEDINTNFGFKKRGWGSLRVLVRVGETSWKTSIFPDKKSNCYILPLKAEIRKKENILENSKVVFHMEIIL